MSSNYNYEYQGTDYVYYNAMFTNTTTQSKEARLVEYRSEPILNSAKDYYLSVIRFNVPIAAIPLFIYPYNAPGYTIDNTKYSVTITDSFGNHNQAFTQYTYLDNVNLEPRVYTIQHFLDMINEAFRDAYNSMAGPKPATYPYIVFDAKSKYFSLIAENDWQTGGVFNYKIYMNSNLFTFFDYWEAYFNGFGLLSLGRDFQIIIKNNGNNAITAGQILPPDGSVTANNGYIMTQEEKSIDKWQAIRSILFVSNSISVKPEYININVNYPNLNSGDTNRSVLTDFEPPLISDNILRGYLQYFPQGPYRLIDLTSDSNLQTLDFQLFWQDNLQRIYPIYVNPNDTVTIKIMFVRKSAINGSQLIKF